ncbi:MAG: Rieske (2Fe-2S) protein [Dehalococcoidales bacterium]|jgi:3-phenylpropionate/trans-cinnamate dioxygenase ferredoxin subunit|nr:Rieske (2Fe-2S) protein [Dehalococcoidales bacterium]MDX9986829.1 Rieske (2Fe-2S) protein [Dehalococcoidales bacterium]NLE89866.1 Rieske (2Fe-2S) protein [Dehalococcoidales bacterium]
MTESIIVATVNQIKPGEMKSFAIGKRQILIARQGDTFYAADNKCPHMGGNLSKGTLNGHEVTCPVHNSKFDLVDGKVLQWTEFGGLTKAIGSAIKKPKSLKTYPVVIKDGEIRVVLDQ